MEGPEVTCQSTFSDAGPGAGGHQGSTRARLGPASGPAGAAPHRPFPRVAAWPPENKGMKRHRPPVFCWVALWVQVWLALSAGAQPAPGRLVIKGRVVTVDSIGIHEVLVQLVGLPVATSTDSWGNFSLETTRSVADKLPPGPVSIRATYAGYADQQVDVVPGLPTIADGQTLALAAPLLVMRAIRPRMMRRLMSASPVPALAPQMPTLDWPPPKPSTQCVLPPRFLAGATQLRHADDRLRTALSRAGYGTPAYYQIPNGFALVTQLEQISPDAKPLPAPQRWSVQIAPTQKVADWLKSLVIARAGRFRVLVFTVTDAPFAPSRTEISRKAAMAWLGNGLNVLPPAIGAQPCSADCRVTALVYEFEKVETQPESKLVPQSSVLGGVQLVRTGILPALP